MPGKGSKNNEGFFRRSLTCPRCGSQVRIPTIWILGIESVFACTNCKARFKTGFKMGAVLFAIALVLALATTNLGAYIFSSLAIPLMALLTLPLWILYGFVFRKWWLVRKAKKEIR